MAAKTREKEENSVELPAPPEMDGDMEREEDSEDQSLSALGAANVDKKWTICSRHLIPTKKKTG